MADQKVIDEHVALELSKIHLEIASGKFGGPEDLAIIMESYRKALYNPETKTWKKDYPWPLEHNGDETIYLPEDQVDAFHNRVVELFEEAIAEKTKVK